MADSPNKKAHDLSTFLEDNGQEPSHTPIQIEDYEDISTYVFVEDANGAPLFVPPSSEQSYFIIITDDDHMKDISMEAFLEHGDQVPLQPTDTNQEYTLSELFSDVETTLSPGTSLSLERSIPDPNPIIQKSSLEAETAGTSLSLERSIPDPNPIIQKPSLEAETEGDIDLEGIDWITLGSQHLYVNDDALGALISKHQIFPLCDIKKMTNFQRITRQLMELISVPQKKATIYMVLANFCHPDIVRPHSVRTISEQQLIDIGVASESKAMILLDLSKNFAEAGDDKMSFLLSDEMLNYLSDNEIFNLLQEVRGLEAYVAFTIMLFGLERMLNFWPDERELGVKYDRFNKQLERWPWSSEAVAASKSWEPFKGLAAWIIWTHV